MISTFAANELSPALTGPSCARDYSSRTRLARCRRRSVRARPRRRGPVHVRVAGIADTITVEVELVRVGRELAVVVFVEDAVAIEIGDARDRKRERSRKAGTRRQDGPRVRVQPCDTAVPVLCQIEGLPVRGEPDPDERASTGDSIPNDLRNRGIASGISVDPPARKRAADIDIVVGANVEPRCGTRSVGKGGLSARRQNASDALTSHHLEHVAVAQEGHRVGSPGGEGTERSSAGGASEDSIARPIHNEQVPDRVEANGVRAANADPAPPERPESLPPCGPSLLAQRSMRRAIQRTKSKRATRRPASRSRASTFVSWKRA